jgi:hypothetical protein
MRLAAPEVIAFAIRVQRMLRICHMHTAYIYCFYYMLYAYSI